MPFPKKTKLEKKVEQTTTELTSSTTGKCHWFDKKPCWAEFNQIRNENNDPMIILLACVVCQLKDMNRMLYTMSK